MDSTHVDTSSFPCVTGLIGGDQATNTMPREAQQVALEAACNLPKPSELFVSDIHGEFDSFSHIVHSSCGDVRKLIDDVFSEELSKAERGELAAFIYFPHKKYETMQKTDAKCFLPWLERSLDCLARLCNYMSAFATVSQLRSKIGGPYAGLILELVHACEGEPRTEYRASLVARLAREPFAVDVAEQLAALLNDLLMPQIHIVGDVYDRGPAPDAILDLIEELPHADIEWGNHDMVWMGAALGQRGCIAHVVRNCARYGNLGILTDSYGLNLQPLYDFALKAYDGGNTDAFALKSEEGLDKDLVDLCRKVQKAVAILQFKVEGQLIDKYPSFGLESRKLLGIIDYDKKTVVSDGVEYALTDIDLPTVDRTNPYALTEDEERVMSHLKHEFLSCEKLQRHIKTLLDRGSLYKVCNGNLLLHACVPLNPDGSLKTVDVFGVPCAGKSLYDECQKWVYAAFRSDDPAVREKGRDFIWYLWLGEGSPLFAKSKMATFEIYLCEDKAARKEEKNSFYKLFDDPSVYENILQVFGLDPETGHIICGHVPVKAKKGEDPVKANGKVICIDGGMSTAYQKSTGIAGYGLVSRSTDLTLYAFDPFPTVDGVVSADKDVSCEARVIETYNPAKTIADTDCASEVTAYLASMTATS